MVSYFQDLKGENDVDGKLKKVVVSCSEDGDDTGKAKR
jgi:hypothetical protein